MTTGAWGSRYVAPGTRSAPPRRVLVIAAGSVGGDGLIDEVRGELGNDELEVAVVAPAVEPRPAGATGERSLARQRARLRLDARLDSLRRAGIRAVGMLGEGDPLRAVELALERFEADEVVVCERAGDPAWGDGELLARARAALDAPVRLVSMPEPDAMAVAAGPDFGPPSYAGSAEGEGPGGIAIAISLVALAFLLAMAAIAVVNVTTAAIG